MMNTHINDLQEQLARVCAERDAAIKERNRFRGVLEMLLGSGPPRPRHSPYRTHGMPSKHDRCKHGFAMYEDCGQCTDEFIRAALGDS